MPARSAIDDLLAAAVAAGDVPFVTGGVVTRDGAIHISCHGTDPRSGKPVHARSVHWIASMTKALTSVAALQLVERGLLDLDTPIGNLLPALKTRNILVGFYASGKPVLRPAQTAITLAHLLTHTSGFVEGVWNADILRYLEVTGAPSTAAGLLAGLDMPLMFEPGTAWHYGISHDWVGQAIEAASGQRLDRYFADHLFSPLGMTDTAHVLNADQQGRLVSVHARAADGTLALIERKLQPEGREFLSGGGTMFSTAPDYLAFIAMLLGRGSPDGKTVLRPETVAAMAEIRTGHLRTSWIDPALPAMSNAVEFLPDARKGWGLGTMVNLEELPTGRRAGSMAWAGLGNTYFWVDPASGLGGVLLTQILPFADRKVMDLLEAFESATYRAFA